MPGIVAGARGPYPPEDPVLSISADRVAVEGDHKRLPVRTEDHLFAAVGARWSLPGCCLSANHRLPLMPGSDPAAHVGRSYATGRPLGASLPSNPGSSPGRRCPSTGKKGQWARAYGGGISAQGLCVQRPHGQTKGDRVGRIRLAERVRGRFGGWAPKRSFLPLPE